MLPRKLWTDDYIAGLLTAGHHVPDRRLNQYIANINSHPRPRSCERCGKPSLLYLTLRDLTKSWLEPDDLVYLCGVCRGQVLSKSHKRPRGRPKKDN